MKERLEAKDDKEKKEITAWLVKSESEPGLRRMLELVKSEPGIPIAPAGLDRDPFLLNALNGTVELRTGLCALTAQRT